MDRLRPPPSNLPPRVLLICFMLAQAMLWRDGGTFGDAAGLIFATLPLEAAGPSALRLLLGRVMASFALISLALVIGLSCALALALLVSRLGGRTLRIAGWLGRALTGVVPMAWALGALVWLIQAKGLPVETLFPFQPRPEMDTFALRLGRGLWSWLVPALVLALPVFGAAFFSLTHWLSAMLHDLPLARLKARGLGMPQILYRHFVPRLRVHLARLARPVAAMLLAFDIPIEELLGFDGWGRAVAAQLKLPAASGHTLAALLWMGGWMLAAVLGWLFLLDRRGLPLEEEDDSDAAQRSSMKSTVIGALLALLLMLVPGWLEIGAAQLAWKFEIVRALGVSVVALMMVIAVGFFMGLTRRGLIGRGWTAALTVTPLLLTLLLWEKQNGRQWWAVVLVAAIPGIAAFREIFRDAEAHDYIEVSRALGQRRIGVWWHHLLPGALPGLLNLALRNTGSVLLMLAVLDFYSTSSQSTWGALMRRNADRALDDPMSVLAPAILLALWSLSFRLLSRAFRTEAPAPRTSPFDR